MLEKLPRDMVLGKLPFTISVSEIDDQSTAEQDMFCLLKYDWLINWQNCAFTISTEIHCRKVGWIQVFILKLTFFNFNKDIHYVTSNLIHMCRSLKYNNNKLISGKREVPRFGAGKSTQRFGESLCQIMLLIGAILLEVQYS